MLACTYPYASCHDIDNLSAMLFLDSYRCFQSKSLYGSCQPGLVVAKACLQATYTIYIQGPVHNGKSVQGLMSQNGQQQGPVSPLAPVHAARSAEYQAMVWHCRKGQAPATQPLFFSRPHCRTSDQRCYCLLLSRCNLASVHQTMSVEHKGSSC